MLPKMPSSAKLLGIAVLAVSMSVSVSVMSADHAESPGADADPAGDLADVFIFPSPGGGNKTVGAITFGGRPAPRSRIDANFYCDRNILYTFNIDRDDTNGNFDNVPDIQIFARLGTNSAGTCGLQLENVPGAGGTFSGPSRKILMNQNDFHRLVDQGFNRIPVAREVLADLDTPLSTYLKLADAPYSYLLESVQGGEKWGRYSIIGLPCRKIIRVRGQRITLEHAGEFVEALTVPDPLAWIQDFQTRYRVPATGEGLPRFIGGLVGYFGYDTIRYIEPKLAQNRNPDPLDNPDILLLVSEDLVVFDNLAGRLYLITLVDPAVEFLSDRL